MDRRITGCGLYVFYLSFYFYILFRDSKKSLSVSILSFSAILFKEPALTLLIVLVAYDYLFKIG
jgi:hypothetical protein